MVGTSITLQGRTFGREGTMCPRRVETRIAFENTSGGRKRKTEGSISLIFLNSFATLRWLMVYNRFERFTFFKPPALPEVSDVRLAWHTCRTQGRPPLPDGRSTPTGQGQPRKRDVWRKHEAEPMYVANSEPAIWRWGEG